MPMPIWSGWLNKGRGWRRPKSVTSRQWCGFRKEIELMAVKSLSLIIPDVSPYDRQDSWFQSFVGNNLIPIVERRHVQTILVHEVWDCRTR